MKWIWGIAGIALLVGGLGIGGLYIPHRGFDKEVFLDFPKGTSTAEMGEQLAKAGVIRYPWQFELMRLISPGTHLQAGEYSFKNSATVGEVYRRIARGDVYHYEVRIPEGSNLFEIAAIVGESGIIKAEDFVKVADDAKPVHDLAPAATTLEGYLFPSTYHITRHTSAAQLAHLMIEQFRKQWKAAGGGSRDDAHAVVTLASLVEKETAVARERPEVASVYANRLRQGMRLDCDPTTIYAAILEDRYRGKIYQSDLKSESPYNTYKHKGLPPGPIANPGVASLKAALHPAETDYLFFVAKPDGSGGHNFSRTLREHNQSVQQYRHGQN